MALTTKSEVISGAFTRVIQESRIPTDLLEVVQYKYIFPILGKDFYNAVIAAPASYTPLLAYIKPVIYWYVKYMMMPELRYELSDLGANQINITGATPVTDEGAASMMNQCLIIAESKVQGLNDYLKDNYTLYPLYYRSLNASENCQVVGGIVMRNKKINLDINTQ